MDSLSYQLISKKKATAITANSNIEIKAKPFSMVFITPKEAETIVNIQCSFDSLVYAQHINGDSLSQLVPWESSNAMAVAISSYSELITSLNLCDDSRQPYVHDGMHFSSFNHVDSTENWLTLILDFNQFVDVDGISYEKGKQLDFKKAKKRKIYILMEVIINPKVGESYTEVIPFVLIVK